MWQEKHKKKIKLYIGNVSAAIVKVLAGGISPMTRSLLSKTVPAEEMGKLFAFIVPLDIVTAIAVTPVYTIVYNSTIDMLPSAYSFVTAGFTVLATAVLM